MGMKTLVVVLVVAALCVAGAFALKGHGGHLMRHLAAMHGR
jgi:hypothetical protein